MPATADNLRDLHLLHQRAKALRDRLTSGPKTLAARQAALANRQAELETARKALQDAKVQLKKHEHSLQGVETKIDDLKVKLNQVKKNDEYKALQNQIAHDNTAKSKIEEDILLALRGDRDQDRRASPSSRPRSSASPPRSPRSSSRSTSRSSPTRPSSRSWRPPSSKPRSPSPKSTARHYRRIVARYGADALAACEDGVLPRLLHLPHLPDDQRPHQRRGPDLLPELRPAALPDRARGRQHPTHGEPAKARSRSSATARSTARPSTCRLPRGRRTRSTVAVSRPVDSLPATL